MSVSDKNSEYVRTHGRRALTQAGVRTLIAFFGVLDESLSLSLIAIPILIGIWLYNSSLIKKIKEEFDAQNEGNEEFDAQRDKFDAQIAGLDESERAENAPLSWRSVENANKSASQSVRQANEPARPDPKETLTAIHQNLQSGDDAKILQALDSLSKVSFSSEAVRNRLERLAIESANADIRQRALDALDSAPNRAVQKSLIGNLLGRGVRYAILKEIDQWEQSKLLDKRNADTIRRRYNFDFALPPKPTVAPQSQSAVETIAPKPPKPAPVAPKPPKPAPVAPKPPKPAPVAPKPPKPAPVAPKPPKPAPVAPKPPKPALPPQPRPTLLQTLTSEGAIKIYLYLGAFFVVAAAAILGFLVEALRLPILFVGTLLFGGAAVALKKRLPQPSFALFIVFSFLIVITANALRNTIRDSSNLTQTFSDAYWAIIFFLIALVWAGGVWLYESRFFSIAAFGALTLSAFRLGNLIEVNAVYYLLFSLDALLALAGVWLIRKWKDAQFALPLFRAAQVVHFLTLAISLSEFIANTLFGHSLGATYLIFLATWMLGTLFYLASDFLQPSALFPFFAAATLLPMPWFVSTTFHLENLGISILLFIWSAFFIVASEALVRLDKFKKYSLPLLLSALPNLFLSLFFGYKHGAWLGLLVALGGAILMTALHISRQRWAIWAWALVHFAIAYFAFFQLKAIQNLHIYFGYPLVGSAILFLLPDLILKKDWSHNLKWRLLPRRFGVFFLSAASFYLIALPAAKGHVAALYFVLALLTAAYALAYRKFYLGYLPALYLVPAVGFAFSALDLNLWRPALTSLAVLYYLIGVLIRGKQKWSETLRNSGLILGSSVALVALALASSSAGWLSTTQIPESLQNLFVYLALGIWYGSLVVFGLLFFVETRLRRNGLFEIGAPIILSIAAYLILKDFHIKPIAHYLFAFALIWLLEDLFGHFVFKAYRQLGFTIRAIGAGFAALNAISLLIESNASISTAQFGIYALLFLALSLIYRQPFVLYASTLSFSLATVYAPRAFSALDLNLWRPALTSLAVLYYLIGVLIRGKQKWSETLRNSGLILGSSVALVALALASSSAGWLSTTQIPESLQNLFVYLALGIWYGSLVVFGLLFFVETRLRRNGLFEIGAPIILSIAAYLILKDFHVIPIAHYLFAFALIWLLGDLFGHFVFKAYRQLGFTIRAIGAGFAALNAISLLVQSNASISTAQFGIYALLFLALSLIYRQPFVLYASTLSFSLATVYAPRAFSALDLNLWRPTLTSLAVLYYLIGVLIRGKQKWSETLRNSGLILGSSVALVALALASSSAGWLSTTQIPESLQTLFIYLALGTWYGSLVVFGLLFFVETRLRRNGFFEIGAPIILSIAAYLILKDFHVIPTAHYLFAFALIWLLGDLVGHFVFKAYRQLGFAIRAIGAGFAALNYVFLMQVNSDFPSSFFGNPSFNIWLPPISFGIYAILAAAFCLVYRKPKLLYIVTLTLSLFAASLFKAFGIDQWIYPVIFTAMGYYVAGAFLRAFNRLAGWDDVLLKSGFGLGIVVSISAFFFGGWGAAIPAAITASFWAFEAYFKRDVRLAFPANGFYLLAYFIVLRSFNVAEPQLFSVGTALFGLIQHYLLTRANSKKGAYIMGMLSQFILLGTTYIEMINKNDVNFFFLLFVQSMIVLIYGIVVRSRSLTFFPIGFVVLGVITITYSALKNTGTIVLVGCTGILLLLLGIGAALLRERIAEFGERFEEWDA